MSTQQENYFDDSIRRKLKSAEEEVPFAFDDIATKLDVNANDYLAWIRGFLFSDAILLLLAFSFVKFTNVSTAANHGAAPVKVVAADVNQSRNTNSSSTNNQITDARSDDADGSLNATATNISSSTSSSNTSATVSSHAIASSNRINSSRRHTSSALRSADARRQNSSLPLDASLLALSNTGVATSSNDQTAASPDLIAFMKLIGFNADVNVENSIQVQENPAQSYTPPASILFYVSAAPNSLSDINLDKNLNSAVKNSATNFSAGIQLRYTLGKHTSVLTGFEYKRGHLKTSLHDSYKYDALVIDSTVGYIISPFDPPVMVVDYDTSLVSKIGEVSVNGDARISSFMFPVKLAYAWPLGSFTLEPNAGILASFNAAKNTVTHNYSGEPIEYYSEKFKFNDLTYALTAGINVSYLLSPKLKMFVAANYLKWMNYSASYKAVNYTASPQLNGSIGVELKIK